MHLLTVVCNLELDFNPKTASLLEYLKVIPYTKFEHFGIFRFWVMLQTNKLEHLTHVDRLQHVYLNISNYTKNHNLIFTYQHVLQ